MGKTTKGNGADELVLQLKTELAAVVEVLCVLHDFIDTSFGSKFQQFCETNSVLRDKVKVLKSLKSKCTPKGGISADSGLSSKWKSNEKNDKTETEREETTFSEWPDNVPVVMEDDPLSNLAGKCEVKTEADEEVALDFFEEEMNVTNYDYCAADEATSSLSVPGPSNKAGLLVIRQPPSVGVTSSSPSIFLEESENEEEIELNPSPNPTQSEGKGGGGDNYKCSMCSNKYSSEESLRNHYQYKHSTTDPK